MSSFARFSFELNSLQMLACFRDQIIFSLRRELEDARAALLRYQEQVFGLEEGLGCR